MPDDLLVAILQNRPLPGSDGSMPTTGDGQLDSFNLIFIVGFAVLITVLARWLSTRGRRK
ncbi:hypothetical protein LJC60_00485 [Ruminococcaceae bacterium OttesenSCG-928-D13]|nr:hypothetical protein [Ruminococcaceae bacterium OttesenSCG-928-D13]